MALRKQKRDIAKARLKVIGVDRVNRRLKTTTETGEVIWRKVLSDKAAHDEQAKGKKPVKLLKKTNERKVKKVTA